jgi:hypothetical protein
MRGAIPRHRTSTLITLSGSWAHDGDFNDEIASLSEQTSLWL